MPAILELILEALRVSQYPFDTHLSKYAACNLYLDRQNYADVGVQSRQAEARFGCKSCLSEATCILMGVFKMRLNSNHMGEWGPGTFLALSIWPCSARELGDSGRMIPAMRMMKPGTAAQCKCGHKSNHALLAEVGRGLDFVPAAVIVLSRA